MSTNGFTQKDLDAVAEEFGIEDKALLNKKATEVLEAVEKEGGKIPGIGAVTKAAKEMTAVAIVEPSDPVPMREVNVSEYLTAATTIDPKRDFYKGPNGKTLSKTGLDKLARAANINTEIVSYDITDDRIIVKVRGWIGEREHPVMETEDIADYSIRDKSEEFIMEKIKRGKVTEDQLMVDDQGRIMFKSPIENIAMKSYLNKDKEFALRATVSKAENRVKRKLMGLNSMDEKEAELLKQEFVRVNRRYAK